MIQTLEDATFTIELGESDEDILNEVRALICILSRNFLKGLSKLALNINKTHLAFSTDSGTVGVLDLSTNVVSRMKTKHESVGASTSPRYMFTHTLLGLRLGQIRPGSFTRDREWRLRYRSPPLRF